SDSAETISGITSMNSRRRKILPAGSVTYFTNPASAGASLKSRWAADPRTSPMSRPISMRAASVRRMARQYAGTRAGEATTNASPRRWIERAALVFSATRRTRMIRLRDLTKNYGEQQAVKGITLEIPDGQLVGLLGPNGAGKTTTIRMLTGML